MRKLTALPLLISVLALSSCNTSTLSNDLSKLGNDVFGNVNLASVLNGTKTSSALSQTDIATAFKQALTIGSENVVGQLSQVDGFNKDSKIHIPLPHNFEKVQSVLKMAGLSFMLDDLETRLNRAAEIATPHAKELFFNAIFEMDFEDVMSIYTGPQDSATTYFRNKMSLPLAGKMRPFIEDAIAQAGVVASYDKVMAKYKAIPLVPDVKTDLTNYVVGQGIDGIFFYLAEQEKSIRQDPVKQTTALLKKVFGTQAQ